MEETVRISCYPPSDDYYCTVITVPKVWLADKVKNIFDMTLDEFINEYDWDMSDGFESAAEVEGVLISKELQKEDTLNAELEAMYGRFPMN